MNVKWAIAIIFSVVFVTRIALADLPIQVRVDRWLEVRQVNGTVAFRPTNQRASPAQVGNRLQRVGDAISTAARSGSILAVDTNIGFIDVSENTLVRLQELRTTSDGGKITRLQIPQGQARLRVRPFTNDSSELEIETPAGWSGVRGTEFGIAVQPDGKMGVATLDGSVITRAQGETVDVDAGFQNLTIPGEPPSPPVPLEGRGDPSLRLRVLTTPDNETATIIGQIDPVNLLIIEGLSQTVDPDGRFDVSVPLPPSRRIEAVVITPLSLRQAYELAVP
ncbi:MAG: FecR family protein [Elainellaceae cyanobacterium]